MRSKLPCITKFNDVKLKLAIVSPPLTNGCFHLKEVKSGRCKEQRLTLTWAEGIALGFLCGDAFGCL